MLLKQFLRKILARLLMIVFLIDMIPLTKSASNKHAVKAFSSQSEAISPSYIIRSEEGGITFDLSNRLTENMTVESFSFKNTDKSKQSSDKSETKFNGQNHKWFSSDELINGDIYEIETMIYDSESKKSFKYLNSFKYNDTNEKFKPSIRFKPFGYSNENKFSNNDVEIDFSNCKELFSKYKDFKIDILNSDYTPMGMDTKYMTLDHFIGFSYKINFVNNSKLFKPNTDYILRVNASGDIFECLFSVTVKKDRSIRRMFAPNEIPCVFDPIFKKLRIYLNDLNLAVNVDYPLDIILQDANEILPPSITRVIYYEDFVAVDVPDAYFGLTQPSNVTFKYGNLVGEAAEITSFQVSFPYSDNMNTNFIWLGMEMEDMQVKDGYKVTKIKLTDNSEGYRIPHSWDNLPKVHYVTMYDMTKTKQIGGELRVEVINDKYDFLDKNFDVSNANFKISHNDMLQGINTCYFRVQSSSNYQEWREAYVPFTYYADILQFSFLEVYVDELSVSKQGTNLYNFRLTPKGIEFKSGDIMSIIDDEGNEHKVKTLNGKNFSFSNVPVLMGGKYLVTLNGATGLIYFNSIDSSILFNPSIIATNIDNQEAIDIKFDNKLSSLLNAKSSNNNVKILHENGNPTENNFSNIVSGSNKFKLNKGLVKGERYILEFNNGSDTFKTTFEYAPLRVFLDKATGTTAKLAWEYPNNYLIMEGDILNIYFKKDGYSYQAVPDAKIVHGFQDIDFDKVRTYTIKNLSPNINYTAKLELITSTGLIFSSEVEFVTSDFKILNETIDGLSEEGVINKKNIDVTWDLNKSDMEFSQGDRIDIFLKLKSHDVFPRTPVHVINEDLNRVRRASIKVPNFEESYSLKIVYNIGGTRHSGNILNFDVKMKGTEINASEIKSSSFIINWIYPEEMIFTEGQELRLFIKKSNDPSFPNEPSFRAVQGGETNLKNIVNYKFENLNEDTIYQVKLEHKIDEKTVAGVKEEVLNKDQKEVRTVKFLIDGFKVIPIEGKKIKLKWNVSEKDFSYSDQDKIDVYIKERSHSDYSNQKINTKKDFDLREVEFDLDKYDTEYDIKVAYTLLGKEVSGYTKYILKIGEVLSKIDEIQDNSVTISWTYPKNYQLYDGDKIEIIYKKKDDGEWKNGFDNNSQEQQENGTYKLVIPNLEKDQNYELKFIFTPNGLDPRETYYTFKATNNFQISRLYFKNINSKSIKLNWDVYPKNYNFDSKDKVEVLYKKVEDNSKNGDETVAVTKSENLSKFNNFTVEGLEPEKDYIFKIKYTINKTSDSNSPITIEETINAKTFFGKFDYFTLDTGVSSVKFEVAYPENYEIKANDTLDIFVRDKKEASYSSKANFTAVHGENVEGFGEVDLNEINVLDILGLSPNTDYIAKAVFWPEGGKGVKVEKEVNFKTGLINGLEEVFVVNSKDHLVTVGIKMNPDEIVYGSDAMCKLYVKKKTDPDFPNEPSGEANGEMLNETNTADAYFEDLNTEYNIKVILSIGSSVYEKIIDFTSKVDELAVEVKEINPMTAQIEWKYPQNYTLVDGEKVQIFTKYKDEEAYSDTPDLELVQSEALSLADINLIELSALIPDTDYDVKVDLKLLETELPPVTKSFTTDHFSIEDLSIKSISEDAISISWSLDTEEIEFMDDYDNLGIFVKRPDDEEYNFSEPVAEFTKGLNELRSASFNVNRDTSKLDILVSYLVEDYESFSELKFSPITVETSVKGNDVLIAWEYPEGAEFVNGDRIDFYLRTFDNQNYPPDPLIRQVHGEDGDLTQLTEIEIGDVDQGSYVLKLQLTTDKVNYSPVEAKFDIVKGVSSQGQNSSNNSIPVTVVNKVMGRGIVLGGDFDAEIDFEKEIAIKPSGLKVEAGETESEIVIKNLVPGKEYKVITVVVTTLDDEKIKLSARGVKIESENPLQQFITNIYNFAFERFPDEEGYSYWLDKLMERKEITGKYVLYNLMFAEREFSDRNLPDDELIKVLYQIVVNRTYDEGGLQFWIKEYNETFLPNANNDKFEAQKAIVTRMLYEQEFKDLCDKLGILW